MKCIRRKCDKEVFPELVVCYDHADKESLAMLARNLLSDRNSTIKKAADICLDESDSHCNHEIQEKCCKQGCIALSVAAKKIEKLAR